MCGGVRRQVSQSWLERAQRAMHGVRSTAHEAHNRRAMDREAEKLDALLFARLKTDKTRYEL